ncbi:MAG: tryptophan-rich sensory protein [Clostridia bacterium]|nr:tryptophan-rich sensory protein [Clostridia bacterium]
MKKINFKILAVCILIPLILGTVSGILTSSAMDRFEEIAKPPLSPPGFLFPIVWTLLYILMGISSYLVFVSTSEYRKEALTLYGIQLVFNFIWPVIFFNFEKYLFAFIWLIALLVLVILMTLKFYKIDKKSAYLQIPYILWLIFAGYLNLGVYLLNR